MSLLQRVEQAQKRAEAAEAAEASALVPAKAPARAPAPAPTPQNPAQVAAREELLRDIRVRLQDEVMSAFDTLLDVADPADLRAKVEVIVDRVIDVRGFAVTHDERIRLIEDTVGEIGGLGPLEPLL